MAIGYPGVLDTSVGQGPPANVRTTTATNDATYDHGAQHADISSAVVALQTKVGATASADTNSLVNQMAGVLANPLLALLNATPTVAYNQFPDRLVAQRAATTGGLNNKGTATIALSLTSTSLVGLIEYRLRDATANGNPTLKDWTAVAAFQTAGANGAISLLINDFPAGLFWYFLDVRINANQVTLGTRRIGCGELSVIAGQSLAIDFLNNTIGSDTGTTVAAAGVTPGAYTSAFATTGNSYPSDNTAAASWASVGDGGPYASTGVCEYLRLVSAKAGVNASLVGHAIGNSAIADWAPGQGFNTTLKSIVTASGGAFGAFLWVQGHKDAQLGTTSGAWTTALQAIVADLAAAFPSVPFVRLICSIPAFGATTQGTVQQISAIRLAALNYVASDPASNHIDGLGMGLGTDLMHPTQAGDITFSRYFYRDWRGLRLADAGYNAGPKLVGGTRTAGSANVAITIAHDKGTDVVVGTGAVDQFAAFAAGSTSSPLALSALTRVDATHLQLTLSATPADGVALGIRYRDMFLDTATTPTHSVTDNWAGYGDDGLTNPTRLRLTAAELNVAAPGVTTGGPGAGSAPPSITPTLLSQFDASATGVFFSDSALTTAQSTVGGTIAGWKDSTANLRHATNTVGGSSLPTLEAGSQNGVHGVNFFGSTSANSQFLRNRLSGNWLPLQSTSLTMLLVCKVNVVPNFFMVGSLYASSNTSGGTNLFGLQLTQTTNLVRGMRTTATVPAAAGPTYPGTGTLMKVVVRFDLPNNTIYCAMNSATEVSTTTTGPYTGTGLAGWDTFALGEAINRFYLFNGIVYEAAVWNGLATTADRDSLLTYCTNKWGA